MTAPSRLTDFTAIPFARPGQAPANETRRAKTAQDGSIVEDTVRTPEGIALKPTYRETDLEGLDFIDSWPGLPPFVRGPYPTMYVKKP